MKIHRVQCRAERRLTVVDCNFGARLDCIVPAFLERDLSRASQVGNSTVLLTLINRPFHRRLVNSLRQPHCWLLALELHILLTFRVRG